MNFMSEVSIVREFFLTGLPIYSGPCLLGSELNIDGSHSQANNQA